MWSAFVHRRFPLEKAVTVNVFYAAFVGSSQAERHGMGVHDGSSRSNGGSIGASSFWCSHLASGCNLRSSSYPEWNLCLLPPWDAKHATSWYHPRRWGQVSPESLVCLQDVLLKLSLETVKMLFCVNSTFFLWGLKLLFVIMYCWPTKAECGTCWKKERIYVQPKSRYWDNYTQSCVTAKSNPFFNIWDGKTKTYTILHKLTDYWFLF